MKPRDRTGNKLSRRDLLMLGGAGALGAAGVGLAGLDAYRRLAGPQAAQGPPVSLAQSVGRSIGLTGATGMNFIVVVIDSLRKDYVGAYGGDTKTPGIDALARDGLRFDRAVPEAMPTIPARRSIHTGIRAFPFRDWYTPKGENVGLYGWQPVPEDQWTLSEMLKSAGYQTFMVSDNYHEAKASYNFQRGFDAFEYIRGQEKDLFAPVSLCPEEAISNTLMSGERAEVEGKMRQYFANTLGRAGEDDYFAPQVFSRASEWLEYIRESDRPFFMLVDSFDPHEPWDPPDEYVRMYGEGYDDYDGKEPYVPVYGNADYLEESQLERMKTLYRAEVSMVDRWFGRFMDRAESLGMMENTAVVLVSDHGVALGEHGVVGKPHYALWPEVTDVPLIIRHPESKSAGEASDYRASTHDLVPTILSLAGITPPYDLDGVDLAPLLDGDEVGVARDHFTTGLHDRVMVRDDDYALLATNRGDDARLYDLRKDPGQQRDIASENTGVVERMYREYVRPDAGGDPPTY